MYDLNLFNTLIIIIVYFLETKYHLLLRLYIDEENANRFILKNIV